MRFDEISPSFCVYPFAQASSSNRGTARICCRSVASKEKHPVKARDFGQTPFQDVFNNEYLREVRRRMLNGEHVEACRRCHIEEAANSRSRRMQELSRMERASEADRQMLWRRIEIAREHDGTVALPPMNYDLHFGNACNSKCRTCWPDASRPLQVELETLAANGEKLPRHTMDELRGLKDRRDFWHQDGKLFAYLHENIEYVRRLQIAGGESLMIDHLFAIVDRLFSRRLASQVDVELVTNLTIFDLDFFIKMRGFRRVELLCSMDGMGRVNEYIRYPSRWSKVEANLRNIMRVFRDSPNVEVYIQVTVSNLNLFYLTDLLDWLVAQDFSRPCHIVLNHVHTPEFYHPSVMPAQLRRQCREKLQAWLILRRADREDPRYRDRLDVIEKVELIERLLERAMPEHDLLLSEVRRFTDSLDRARRQSARQSLPEIAELFGEPDGGRFIPA